MKKAEDMPVRRAIGASGSVVEVVLTMAPPVRDGEKRGLHILRDIGGIIETQSCWSSLRGSKCADFKSNSAFTADCSESVIPARSVSSEDS